MRPHDPAPAALEVKTRRGTFTKKIEYALGHPSNPISAEALAQKFRDCAAHSVRPLSEQRISDLIATVGRLETLSDVRELTELLG